MSTEVCYGDTLWLNRTLSGCSPEWPLNPCTNNCYEGYANLQYFFEDMKEPSAVIIYRYVYPILVLLTVVTSILVFIVLSRKQMQSPTNNVLMFMSAADLGVAVVPFPFYFVFIVLGIYKYDRKFTEPLCYLALYSTDTLPPLFHSIAIWLTVLLAAQRCLSIRHPVRSLHWCTMRNVRIASLIIVIVSFVFALQRFVEMDDLHLVSYAVINPYTNRTIAESRICIYRNSKLVDAVGQNAFFNFYYWCRVVLFVSLPSLLLIIFSVLLIRSINEAKGRRRRLTSDVRLSQNRRQNDTSSTNKMLVVIVIIFLVVNLPQGIILALFSLSQIWPSLKVSLNNEHMMLATHLDNMLILGTYPINFAIYCSMSAQFRQTFVNLFYEYVLRREVKENDLMTFSHRNSMASVFSRPKPSMEGVSAEQKRLLNRKSVGSL